MSEARKRTNPFAALQQALADAASAPEPLSLPLLSDPEFDPAAVAGDEVFNQIASNEAALRLLVLVTLPDSRLFRSFRRDGGGGQPAEVAAGLAELVLTNHRLLHSVGAPHDDLWSVIETPGALLLVRPLRLDFALGGLFGAPANQGSARLSMRRLIRFIEPALPEPSFELSF